MKNHRPREAAIQCAIALLYALVGKLTLDYFSINGAVSVFWPASGLALAALLIGGKRYAWGIFIGSVIQTMLTGIGLYEVSVIAASNTVEALLGFWLLTRKETFDPTFPLVRDYLRLIALAGFAACFVSAFVGATTLLSAGFLDFDNYFLNLAQWWMGDVLGIVLIAPFALICSKPEHWRAKGRPGLELAAILGLALLAGQIVFLGRFHSLLGSVPIGYVMFPISIWAALRLGLGGVLAVQILSAIQGLLGAHLGVGFFANDIAQTQLTNYWFYMMSFSIAGATLAALTSQRRQAEADLLAAQNQLAATLRAIPDLLFELEPDGRYREVYASRPELLAAPAAELIGKTVTDVLPAEAAETVMSALREALATGRSHGKQFQLPLAQGNAWFELSVARKPTARGNAGNFIVLSRDVTERRHVEEELQRHQHNLEELVAVRTEELTVAKNAAEAANQAKSEFLASMSHELRTPLNAVIGFSQLLALSERIDAQDKSSVAEIEQAGRHLLGLVNELIDLARIEAGRMEIALQTVEVRPALAASVALTSTLASDLAVDVAGPTDDNAPLAVRADPQRLRQVIVNLLSNAIKYNRPGGTVQLGVERSGDGVRITVSDTGPGIPAERQARLFTPFDRLGREAGTIEGAGIGLAISRRIVEAMGGSMGFASDEERGCTFWVELPADEAGAEGAP